jgi:ribosomal protein S18 acetylase RimI-like enzyme
MPDTIAVRRLRPDDLAAYKALRDGMLDAHPDAFTSDARTEAGKSPGSYLARLGLDRPEGGHFTLGAWRDAVLVGALSCERDTREKVRHIGHLIGMMVRGDARGLGIGRGLLQACLAEARRADGLELLTLSVTAGNGPAEHLYEGAGFVRYGTLRHAIKLGDHYHDKHLMALTL